MNSPIRVHCPHCGTPFRVDASKVPAGGLQAQCTACGGSMPIHLPEPMVPAAEESAPPLETDPPAPASPSSPPPAPPVRDSVISEGPLMPEGTAAPPEVVRHQVVRPSRDREELLEMMLASERERREMAWEMTRELFRLREVVERQQSVISNLVDQFSGNPALARPSSNNTHAPEPPPTSPAQTDALADRQAELEDEMRRLQEALECEREVVDRLRRSKLDLEKRAADAEAAVESMEQRSLWDRLRGRHPD